MQVHFNFLVGRNESREFSKDVKLINIQRSEW